MRKPYGTVHRLTTAKGSQVTIYNEVDEYGRGSSHIITGYRPSDIGPLSGYYARNVRPRDVCRMVRQAEAAGWVNVAASIEAF